MINVTFFVMIPLVIIPPFLGSNLWVTYNNTDLPWYCSRKMYDTPIWLNPSMIIPPFHNCLFKLMTLVADDNGEVSTYPNTTFTNHDFGGVESILHTLKFKFMKRGFMPVYKQFVDYFISKGYKEKENLFAAPYDSRIGPTRMYDYWDKLKNLIIEAYKKNNRQKVVLCGFSLGGSVLQKFLTDKTDKEFRDKYISHGIMIGPAFGGSMIFFKDLWEKRTSYAPFVKNDNLKMMTESWPTFIEIMPNPVLHETSVMMYDENGTAYKGSEMKKLILENDIFTGNYLKSFLKTYDHIHEYLNAPDIPIHMIYNSGYKTTVALNFSKGFKNDAEIIYGHGDGTIGSYSLEAICKRWKTVECYNINCDSQECIHGNIIKNPLVLEAVYNSTNGQSIDLRTQFVHALNDDL